MKKSQDYKSIKVENMAYLPYNKNGNWKVITISSGNLEDDPIIKFLHSLEPKLKRKVFHSLELLETYGYDLRFPYSRYLESGIFELRVSLGNNLVRILYFFDKNKIIILSNAFIKKTQKTPRKEINKAKENRNQYMENKYGIHIKTNSWSRIRIRFRI